MNKGLLVLNILLLASVAVLFYLYFNNKNNGPVSVKPMQTDTASAWEHTPVAYFEMDSIETSFILSKEMQAEVLKREEAINDSLNRMRAYLQLEFQKFQAQRSRLTPEQINEESNRLSQLDQDIKNAEKLLNQDYQKFYMNKQQEVVSLIKDYCREFNKDKKYSYIIANEPGLFYFKDTAYNITAELLKGLNEFYSKKRKN
jgi:outer membrane protein